MCGHQHKWIIMHWLYNELGMCASVWNGGTVIGIQSPLHTYSMHPITMATCMWCLPSLSSQVAYCAIVRKRFILLFWLD